MRTDIFLVSVMLEQFLKSTVAAQTIVENDKARLQFIGS